ncbi:MAG: helix-turn-helix domain-containing protein [Microcystis panniformis]
MNESLYKYHRQKLEQLMAEIGCKNLEELSQLSGLSSWQLQRVCHGLIAKLSSESLVKLANGLQLPVSDLLAHFQIPTIKTEDHSGELKILEQEYQNLQQKLDQQKEELAAEFQRQSIEAIESWLVQWPTAEAVARKNTDLAAVKILSLVKPIMQLLERWGVQPIDSVGDHVSYDPQIHQLIDGQAEIGTQVLVRYRGYRHGEKLRYRAKVSLIKVEMPEIQPAETENVTA